jgi:hypothetical protein
MKRTIVTLACALVAPLAFAQTGTTTTTQSTSTNPVTGTSQTTTSTTSSEGTVSTYTPGKTIVVKTTTGTEPVTYSLGSSVRYVNRAGREIKESLIKPGARVHVYYDGTGETRVVNRVVVDDDED